MIKENEEFRAKMEAFASDNHDDYIRYSVHYSKYGDFAKSLPYINKGVELNPRLNLGYSIHIKLRFLRDYDGALMDINTLDSITPGYQDAAWGEDIEFLRGECYFGKKDYSRAIAHFEKSIQHLDEDWADIHNNIYIGICHYLLNDKPQAIDYFNRTLLQSDITVEAYYWLAKIYFEENNNNQANKNIQLAEKYLVYKRTDPYTEFLNEIYPVQVYELKDEIEKRL